MRLWNESHDPAHAELRLLTWFALRGPGWIGWRVEPRMASYPKDLPIDKVKERPAKPRATTREPPAQKVDDKAAREAALAFEREQKRRDSERRKDETAREKETKRREQAIAKAETALEEAKRNHETKVEEIREDRAALDRRSQAEDARWEKQKGKLETALRRFARRAHGRATCQRHGSEVGNPRCRRQASGHCAPVSIHAAISSPKVA